MKNLLFILFVALSFVFFMACSSDDNSPQQEEMEQMEGENAPSEFNVVVTSIYFDMASINWFQPEGLNNENLMYAISLNGSLIAENLSELNYTFENLEINTEYVVEITAFNDAGTTISTRDFRTLNPDDFTFLLESYQNGEDGPEIRFQYNGDGLITYAEKSSGGIDEFVYFEYDAEENLLNESLNIEKNNYFFFGSRVDITYENNQIIDVGYADSSDSYISYDFISPDNYIVSSYFFNNLVQSREVNLQRANGKITSCLVTDVDTQEIIQHTNFTYENENLVELNDVLNGDLWTFEYDNKNNFYSHKSYLKRTIGAMSHINSTISRVYYNIGYVIEFVDYFNKNNPTLIYRNGELLHTITYEYTTFDYPSKIYLDKSEDPEELTYFYIEN